jgi:putative transposase
MDMSFAFIAKHRHIWPVAWLCEVLEVLRSDLHAWLNRPASNREIDDAKLVTAIGTSFKASDRTYGPVTCGGMFLRTGLPRASQDRAVDAAECSEGAAQAPWKAEGRWRTVGHCRQHPGPGFHGRPAKPEVAGRFHLYLDRIRLAVCRGRTGLVFVPRGRDASLVMDALMMAVWRRGKADALMHHSVQWSQYTCEQFQRLLADDGITCSMSREGNVWDRAMITPLVRVTMARSAKESLFSSLKTERAARKGLPHPR